MTRRRHAFTLIELLVVIAIIAILSAVLLPATSMAHDRMSTATCESRLQRVSLACAEFAADHDAYPDNLQQLLDQGYLRDPEVIRCSRTHKPFVYTPPGASPSPGDVLAACAATSAPRLPHSAATALVQVTVSGRTRIVRR